MGNKEDQLTKNIKNILYKLHDDTNNYVVERILLPCMIKECNRRCISDKGLHKYDDETYCISWFAPKNIIFTSLPIYNSNKSRRDGDFSSSGSSSTSYLSMSTSK